MTNYMIFNVTEINSINFSEVIEDSSNSLRISVDKQKTFVSWNSETVPNSVNNLTTKEGPYVYDDIISILSGPNWTESILPK